MIDFPIEDIKMTQDYVINDSQILQSIDGTQLAIVDLSFLEDLRGVCSGETSSAPNRPTTD
jgi:hypothetical protein